MYHSARHGAVTCLAAIIFLLLFQSSALGNPEAVRAVPMNRVAQLAETQGVRSCAPRISQMTDLLGYNPQVGTMLMTPPADPKKGPAADSDRRLTPVVMAVPMGKSDAYVSTSFAPGQANGCGATYDAVVYWDAPCDSVASTQFSTFTDAKPLSPSITALDGGAATKIFLMAAGTGCVSIKKEVIL